MEPSGLFIDVNILFPAMGFSLIGVNLGLLKGGMGVGVEVGDERGGLEPFNEIYASNEEPPNAWSVEGNLGDLNSFSIVVGYTVFDLLLIS